MGLINDVTTDFSNPPEFEQIAQAQSSRNMTYPAGFSSTQKQKHPDVTSLPSRHHQKGSAEEVGARVRQLIESLFGWRLIAAGKQKQEWTAVTSLLRFKDDIVIEWRPIGDLWEVHMRSKSRLGRNDFGANAKRIESFYLELSKV